MNPLLDESFHIPWSGLKPENVVPDMTIALERAESEMETIRSMPLEEVDFENVPLRFCKAQEDLGEAWNVVSHIDHNCHRARSSSTRSTGSSARFVRRSADCTCGLAILFLGGANPSARQTVNAGTRGFTPLPRRVRLFSL